MNMTIPYSRFQENFKWTCDRVCQEREPILVERESDENIVLMSEQEYASLVETAYLTRSPANARRLVDAMRRPRSEQMKFSDIDELKNAVGL
uniref:Antitoxin n=1 Tax=Candidatus Kentrum sp. TC TaxID=2126339 RepID=A0A450ZYZ6_9GAMM|nr:MAG: antitoxin YefM [Candidatus Kentron sp. TC]